MLATCDDFMKEDMKGIINDLKNQKAQLEKELGSNPTAPPIALELSEDQASREWDINYRAWIISGEDETKHPGPHPIDNHHFNRDERGYVEDRA